jgi:hypothetical protein
MEFFRVVQAPSTQRRTTRHQVEQSKYMPYVLRLIFLQGYPAGALAIERKPLR